MENLQCLGQRTLCPLETGRHCIYEHLVKSFQEFKGLGFFFRVVSFSFRMKSFLKINSSLFKLFCYLNASL